MFRVTPRPSSGAYNYFNSLWFYRWSVVVAALLVVVLSVMDKRQDHDRWSVVVAALLVVVLSVMYNRPDHDSWSVVVAALLVVVW